MAPIKHECVTNRLCMCCFGNARGLPLPRVHKKAQLREIKHTIHILDVFYDGTVSDVLKLFRQHSDSALADVNEELLITTQLSLLHSRVLDA